MRERTPFDHPAGETPEVALLIVADGMGERQAAGAAAVIAGIGSVRDATAAAAAVALATGVLDIVLADIRSLDDEVAERLLLAIDAAAKAAPLRVVVVLRDAQIDLAAAGAFGPHVRLLCDPPIVEMAAMLAEAKHLRTGGAEDSARDDERLKRLNEEVARIAETLARLTAKSEDESGGTVRDVARSYGAPPPLTDAVIAAADVRRAIRARRMRGQFFDAELFADPAWDMLLDLFAAGLEGGRVSVSSLCIAAAVPGTTALRWIGSMTETGFLEREADPNDRRRAYIVLAPRAVGAMRGYFASVKVAGLAAA